jgi:hypothetical protein
VSAFDETRSAGPGIGSPHGPGPCETCLDPPAHTDEPSAEDDGEILRAVTEFVEDLVEVADDVPGTGPTGGCSGD